MPSPEKQPDGTFTLCIDDYEYVFEQWGAQKALEVGVQISGLLSGPLKALGSATGPKDDGQESDFGAIGAGLMAGALENMSTHRLDAIDVIKTLSSHRVFRRPLDGGATVPLGDFNKAYKGRIVHMVKVVKAGLEVQFADFFDEYGAVFRRVVTSMRPKPKSSPAQEMQDLQSQESSSNAA